jgi:hypothetical protein
VGRLWFWSRGRRAGTSPGAIRVSEVVFVSEGVWWGCGIASQPPCPSHYAKQWWCHGLPGSQHTRDRKLSHTVPSCCAVSPAPRASYPIIRAISCTRVCASREPVEAERSCESLAWRHGCVETWAFLGRDMMDVCVDFVFVWVKGNWVEERRGGVCVCVCVCVYVYNQLMLIAGQANARLGETITAGSRARATPKTLGPVPIAEPRIKLSNAIPACSGEKGRNCVCAPCPGARLSTLWGVLGRARHSAWESCLGVAVRQ